jgi:hypothetical protein
VIVGVFERDGETSVEVVDYAAQDYPDFRPTKDELAKFQAVITRTPDDLDELVEGIRRFGTPVENLPPIRPAG